MSTKPIKLGEGSTPGPWQVEPEDDGHVLVTDVQDVTICRVYQQPYDTWQAKDTAELISKAPLLIEAREVLAETLMLIFETPRKEIDATTWRSWGVDVRALLAKLDAE